jgi:YidC/Oxa1 family membrane protein insertase
MMWGLPALSLLFTWWLPASVQLSFFVTGVLSFIQVTCMRQTWFRNFFGMVPLPASGPQGPPPSPYKGLMKRSASPVLTQAELNSRFQNTSTSFPRPPQVPKSGLSKILNSALKPLEPIKDAAKPMMDSARKINDNRNKKLDRNDALKYEEKRRKEIEREKEARAEMERQRRAARKANKKH